MTKNTLVSVIIPAYNHERYVQKTIKSIINQTYENIELIIVNDGSKDSTWQKINEIKDKCEKRFVRVIFETQENQGTCNTLNRLISIAEGEYVYLIASDDIAKQDAIKTEVEFLENNPDYSLVVGDDDFIDFEDRQCYLDKNLVVIYDILKADFLKFSDIYKNREKFLYTKNFGKYDTLYLGNYIPNGYLIKKSIFEKIGSFTSEAPLEDWWLMLQISKYSKMKFIDRILFSYRQHDTNTAKNLDKMHKMADKTLECENNFVSSITNKTDVDPIVFDIHENGVLYKKSGIKYIFEKQSFIKGNLKTKIIKIFNVPVFSCEKFVGKKL